MSEKITIYKKLMDIQSELNAPKNLYNSYGNYSYRNCEGILEAVKPLAKKYGCCVTLQDEIRNEGDKYYVEAHATITDVATLEAISVTAFARESQDKKGMDAGQMTGASSSYARKYALNGLFCIDDSKDSDTNENRIESEERAKEQLELDDPKVTSKEIESMTKFAEEVGVDITSICERFKVGALQDMRMTQYVTAINNLEATRLKNEKAEKARKKAEANK